MRTLAFRVNTTGLILLLGTALAPSSALADVIYQENFENWNNSNAQWSSSTQASLGGTYSTILGRFGAESIRLNIQATTANSGGNAGGEPGSTPFNITTTQFSNNHERQPYPDSSGGGGQGGPTGDTDFDIPQLNLGGAISDGTNPGPPMFGPGTYAVHFDLMLFDSWDGNYAPYGPDSFAVAVNGQTLFDERFYSSAYGSNLNFRNPDEVPALNAYDTLWADSIYRDITVLIELTQATDQLNIDFIGSTTQSLNDESWGLDNILIESISPARSTSVPEIPAPGTLMILGGSMGMLTRRKRRL